MGPGPSDVNPRVLAAMSRPLIAHLDPEFIKFLDEMKEMVKQTLFTKKRSHICCFRSRNCWHGNVPCEFAGTWR